MRAQKSFLRPAVRLLFIGGILFLSLGIFLSTVGRPAAAAGVTVSPRRGPANLSQSAALAAQDGASVQFDLPDQPLCQFEPGPVTATGSYHLPEGQSARLQLHYYIVHPGPTPTEYIDAGLVSGDGTFSITRQWPGIPVPYPDDYLVEIHFGANLLDPVTGDPILESGAGFDYFWYPYVCTPTPPAAPSDTHTPTITVTPTVTDDTPTSTVTATPRRTRPPSNPPTRTPTVTQTGQPVPEDTFTPTPTATATVTETVQPGPEDTFTPTATATVTETLQPAPDDTFTPTPTATVTQESPVQDDTLTPTVTATATIVQPAPDDTLTPTPTATVTLESPVQEDTSTPTPTATLTLPPLVIITQTLTPTTTSTVTATATASVTPSVTATSRPNLVLEGVCAYRVENQQYWRLTNNSPYEVQFLWQATATGETGSASVGANSTAFLVTSGPPQNLRIYVGGILQLEVPSSTACLDYLELSYTCTAENQLAWIVFNNNPYPVNVFWTIDNTQSGSGALAANSAALVATTSVGQHRLSLSWTYPPLGQRTVTLDSDVNTCVFTATPTLTATLVPVTPSLTPSLTASLVPGTPSPTVTNTVPPQPAVEVTLTPTLTATRLPTLGPPVITSTPILIPVTGADLTRAGSLALIGRILTNLGLLFLGAALLIAGALLRAK